MDEPVHMYLQQNN